MCVLFWSSACVCSSDLKGQKSQASLSGRLQKLGLGKTACVVWDFARESGVGSVSWFGMGVRVNSGGFE